MGNDYVYQMLATGNIATLDRYQPTTIVTARRFFAQHASVASVQSGFSSP